MDVLSRRGPPPGSDPEELRRYRERRARGRRERKAARTLVSAEYATVAADARKYATNVTQDNIATNAT